MRKGGFMKEKQLIFIHIPRTGGTSISLLLYSVAFPFEVYDCRTRARTQSIAQSLFLELDEEEQKKFKAITGHIDIKLLKYLNYPTLSFTIFRNPIERVYSLYKHIQQNKHHHLHEFGFSLEELFSVSNYPELFNGITRKFVDYEFGLTDFSRDIINDAFSNIVDYVNEIFDFSDLTKVYKWLIIQLNKRASWEIREIPPLYHLNKSDHERPSKEETQLIIKYNKMDMVLYRKLKERKLI